MFLFISVPMAPSITGFSCPWRAAQWSSEPRLRTQEGHHLVTRHLLQIPLQGDLASTVAVFGISTVNTCWRCLSPAYTWLHKKNLVSGEGTCFTMLWLGILKLYLAKGILTCANHYLAVSIRVWSSSTQNVSELVVLSNKGNETVWGTETYTLLYVQAMRATAADLSSRS